MDLPACHRHGAVVVGSVLDLAEYHAGEADWYHDRSQAVTELTMEYKRIVDLQPAPPPRWTIAAAEAVGKLWWGLVDATRSVPSWSEVQRDPELRRVSRAALDDATRPFQKQTTAAMAICSSYSTKYELLTDASARCNAWLAEHDPDDHVGVDEMVPSATWSVPVIVPGAPLDRDRLPLLW
jgi:hypothetical protein